MLYLDVYTNPFDGSLKGLQPHEVVAYEFVRRALEMKSSRYLKDRREIVAAIRQLCYIMEQMELPEEGLSRHFVLTKLRQIIGIAKAMPPNARIVRMATEVRNHLREKGWRPYGLHSN